MTPPLPVMFQIFFKSYLHISNSDNAEENVKNSWLAKNALANRDVQLPALLEKYFLK